MDASDLMVEDAAREASVSRATVYRAFPGGRQELLNAVVSWAMGEFFLRLYEHVQDADSLEQVMERGIMFAHRSIVEHDVLQRVMQTEPEKLLPALTFESIRIRQGIATFLVPYLAQRGVAPGVDLDEAADFRRPVLAVAIHLHRHVISVQGGIAISRLHRAADPKIERQADHRHARRHLADGVVG